MLTKNHIKIIKKNKRVFILGRGPSARFFQTNKNDVSIGLNIKKKCTITYRDPFIKKNLKLKVGTIEFKLLNILNYLESKLKKINVFLYGFEFNKVSHDDDIEKKPLKKNHIQQLIDINSQLIIFKIIKKNFKNIKIYKMGFSINDDLNPKYTNYLGKEKKKNDITKSSDLKIVGEITTNHKGETDILEKLILGCVKAGVNNIKFQKRDYLNFYSKNKLNSQYFTPISNTFAEYRQKLELNLEQLNLIKFYEKKFDLNMIFSVLDFNSYSALKKIGFKNFKIPSTISNHKNFIKKISEEKLNQIIISTGMTDEKYVQFVLNKFKKFKKVYLLHTISSYPTFFTDININIIKKYEQISLKKKNIIPGYSSHDVGNIGSMLALAAGARMIEKHIKYGITEWMHFDDTAIDVELELPTFVEELEKVDKAMGLKKKVVYKFEHHKY